MRASMSNTRFRQPGSGAPPSNRRARPSEARTRLKNIRHIGALRAALGRQSLDANAFGLARRCPRFKARCRSSRISSSDSGMRLFGTRNPPTTVRGRSPKLRAPATDIRDRRFGTRVRTSNLCPGAPSTRVLSKVVTSLDIGPVANQSRPVAPIGATLFIRKEGMQCHRT
jgi:hypothetical protein